MVRIIAVGALALALGACAANNPREERIQAGAGIGAVTGAVIGGILSGGRLGGAVAGAVIGGATGALAGAVPGRRYCQAVDARTGRPIRDEWGRPLAIEC